MSLDLQVQQLYTVGIPLLEAYLPPMANTIIELSRTSLSRTKWPLVTCRMHVFRGVKWPSYYYTNRKRSSFAMKHFQRKSLKIFKLHLLLRRLVPFCGTNNHVQSEMLGNRHTDTDTQTHRPSTVTLAGHAHQGLIGMSLSKPHTSVTAFAEVV